MSRNYNISDLLDAAFGTGGVYFVVPPNRAEVADLHYGDMEFLRSGTNSGDTKSWMGTPIVYPFTFSGKEYQRYKATGELETVSLNDFQLPAATLITFRRAKNITRTNVLGSNGTVKEIYGFDDWVMDVKGLCLDEPDNPATDQLEKLLQWEELADAIELEGDLFDQLGIASAAMADFSKESIQGKPWVIPFRFQLIADDAAELIVPV